MVNLTRRAVLDNGARVLSTGILALPILNGCAPAPQVQARPGARAAGISMPTYIPFQGGPRPDLPGDQRGLDPGYFKFPHDLVQSVATPPGDGSQVSAIGILIDAPPPPLEQNAGWQAVNKALNVTLQMDQVAGATEYPAKLNTVIAGANLPDFIYNLTAGRPSGVIPDLPAFLQRTCSDLTPYVSGDGIKDYPNLAHHIPMAWRSTVTNGRIYGLPLAPSPMNNVMIYRSDLFEQAGVPRDNAPKDADEFKRMLQAVTRPQENQYGLAATPAANFSLGPGTPHLAMFRVPNNWRLNSSGTLIKDFESEEYAAAVGFARDLWQTGLWHPNTITYSSGALLQDFVAGRFAVFVNAWAVYVQLWDRLAAINPSATIYPMHPFAFDGGSAQSMQGSGTTSGVTYITQQSSPERVKMLLRVANFLAAPFGTTEYLLNAYGVKDVDFTFDDSGAPVWTDRGRSEMSSTGAGWHLISSSAPPLFSAHRSQEFATVAHAAQEAIIGAMVADPTLGLYSATAAATGALAQDTFLAGVSDIVLGRRPVGDLSNLIADWRNRAGDKMRAEFQDALQKT